MGCATELFTRCGLTTLCLELVLYTRVRCAKPLINLVWDCGPNPHIGMWGYSPELILIANWWHVNPLIKIVCGQCIGTNAVGLLRSLELARVAVVCPTGLLIKNFWGLDLERAKHILDKNLPPLIKLVY